MEEAMAMQHIVPTPSAYNFQLIIKHLLQTPLIYAPNQEIVYRDRWRYTYADFGRRVARLANALADIGVRQGDTVAIMDWDSHRYLECFFAVPMMGAVLHTVNVRLSAEQLVYTINHAEDDILLVNEEFVPLLAGVRDKLTTVKRIFMISDSRKEQNILPVDGEYEAMLAGKAESYDFPDLGENTRATTFYTTGTTGLPKGVYFSHRQLVLHTYGLISALSAIKAQANICSDDVYMPITPMFHVHAWGVPFMMTLLGAKQVYPGRYEPEMLLNLIANEKVTFSHCVPTILNMLLACPSAQDVDLNGWKVIIGGSAMSAGLCKAAMARGINLFTGYGMSETCPVLSLAVLKPHMHAWDLDSQIKIRCRTGLPMPNVQLEIVNEEGKALPHDGRTTGEIVTRAPWLTQGYLKDREKSEQLWENGWLHTGDIGFIDEEGYLQVTDRLKDVIKTGGEWISSLTLEDIISRHPAVGEAAVIGVPDDKWGERPLALVVLRPSYEDAVTEGELRDFFLEYAEKGVIPKYGVPDRVVITASIAKTSVGKLNKKELRRLYRQ
jgi:acyl-CoA synthetase (AMP-forming)/AMP-acid ligase II